MDVTIMVNTVEQIFLNEAQWYPPRKPEDHPEEWKAVNVALQNLDARAFFALHDKLCTLLTEKYNERIQEYWGRNIQDPITALIEFTSERIVTIIITLLVNFLNEKSQDPDKVQDYLREVFLTLPYGTVRLIATRPDAPDEWTEMLIHVAYNRLQELKHVRATAN